MVYLERRCTMSKYVAPILSAFVIMALAVAYALFFFLVLKDIDVVLVVKIVIATAAGFVVIGIGAALVSRIKELRGGQEDDISKY